MKRFSHSARRWQKSAHFGIENRRRVLKGFTLWVVGITLLVCNWVWLQVFVLAYMK
eukprot:COSAG02_NODE_40278_length_407_cov_0.844156_1_plen_55_part_10